MDLFFILLFVTLPIISFIFMHVSGFNLLRISPIQLILTFMFVFGFIGTLPLYFKLDDVFVNNGVIDKFIVFQVMLFTGISMIMVVSGALLAKFLTGEKAIVNKFKIIKYNNNEIFIYSFLFIIVIFVLYLYLDKIPKIALFVALLGSPLEASILRSNMGNAFEGYHWYSVIIHGLSNIITFSLFALYLVKKNIKNLTFFIVSFGVSVFTSVMSIEKGPVLWLLIGLSMVFLIVKNQGVISIRLILINIVILIIFGVFMVFIFSEYNSIEKSFIAFISRAFAGSIEPAYHFLFLFPNYENFVYGKTFNNPGGIFPFEPYSYATKVSEYLSPELSEIGVVGSMPTIFWGEAYINFGVFGVFFISFFMGFFIFFIDIIISCFKDTILKIGFYVWMLLHYKDLSKSGFSSFLIDFDFIILFSFFVFSLLISKISLQSKLTLLKNPKKF